MTEKTVRIALIGVGAVGKKYAEMIGGGEISGMELACVCARSEQSRNWTKEHLPGVPFYQGVRILLEHSKEFDAVLIASPHSSHMEYALRAFEAGKHVFCDKPAGISIGQARAMKETAERAGLCFGLMFKRRSFYQHEALKKLMDSGRLGALKRVSMNDYSSFRTAYYHKSCSWRSSWNGEHGGMLINQGQHSLDLWAWLFGMPSAVYARVPFGKYNGFQVDDEVSMIMEYENGMTGTFFMTTGEPVGEDTIEVSGTKGKAVLTGTRLRICDYHVDLTEYAASATVTGNQELYCSWEERSYEDLPEEIPFKMMLENFVEAVRLGTALIADGSEGTWAMELANAAYLSGWKGEKTELPVDADEYDRYLEMAQEKERECLTKHETFPIK